MGTNKYWPNCLWLKHSLIKIAKLYLFSNIDLRKISTFNFPPTTCFLLSKFNESLAKPICKNNVSNI